MGVIRDVSSSNILATEVICVLIHSPFSIQEAVSPTYSERSIIDIHHRKNYYIIPQNRLGQDIYIRTTEFNRISNIIKMPSGDNKRVKVPVSKNMLDSHLKVKPGRVSRSMVTIVIADAEVRFHFYSVS